MYWTTTAPQSEGYYWVRFAPRELADIVYIHRNAAGEWLLSSITSYGLFLDTLKRQYPDIQFGTQRIAEPDILTTADCYD